MRDRNIDQIVKLLHTCEDSDLIELILKLLLESS